MLPLIDAAFGIAHAHQSEFASSVTSYMPRPHAKLLSCFQEKSSLLKEYVMFASKSHGNQTIVEAFNACVDAIQKFRKFHIRLVKDYLFSKAQRQRAASSSLASNSLFPPLPTNSAMSTRPTPPSRMDDSNESVGTNMSTIMGIGGAGGTGLGGSGSLVMAEYLIPMFRDTRNSRLS